MDEGKPSSSLPDTQLFSLLSNLLQQVESLSNQEEVELRAKIEALGLEVSKVPSTSTKNLNEVEIAAELDKLSAKLENVDSMISSADAEVKSLLSGTAYGCRLSRLHLMNDVTLQHRWTRKLCEVMISLVLSSFK